MKLKNGMRLEQNKMIMVVTGETKTSYLGYHEYKGKPVGQCSISKESLTNPHMTERFKILNK